MVLQFALIAQFLLLLFFVAFMLTDTSVDQIFENTWIKFTESKSTRKQDLIKDYLEALDKEAAQRPDRTLPRMEAFIDAARTRLGESAIGLTEKGFAAVLPDISFYLVAARPDWFVLKSTNGSFSTTVTVMEPQQAAILMDAAGHFIEKAGGRWDEYLEQRKEEERIWEIEYRYGREKSGLIDRFAKALADGEDTTQFAGDFRKMIADEADERGTPLSDSEVKSLTASFLDEGQRAMKALIKRREAAEKARVKA